MWKGESPEVRTAYHKKAMDIKAHLMAIYPDYRYSPRKSGEIRRRATRRNRGQIEFEHNAHQSAAVNNRRAGIVTNSEITRRIPGAQQFLPPVAGPWTPFDALNVEGAAPGQNAPVPQMNANEDFEADVNNFIDNWDVNAEVAQMMAEI